MSKVPLQLAAHSYCSAGRPASRLPGRKGDFKEILRFTNKTVSHSITTTEGENTGRHILLHLFSPYNNIFTGVKK